MTKIVDIAIANAGVSRTAVGEVAHNRGLNQGRAFSLFGFCNSIGYVIGPLIGGFLARPAQKFSWDQSGNLFARYPYLLPCAVSSLYSILVSVIAMFFLDETNQNISHPKSTGPAVSAETPCEALSEQDPLLETPKVVAARIERRNSTWYCIIGVG